MSVSTEDVKKLREMTGAGVLDCKKALQETGGDIEKAIEFLRKKGIAGASKKLHRETLEGMVDSYIHPGNRVGVLLEVNCETDFVARTDDFKTLVHDLAMHIAAMSPRYVSREDIPADVLEKEKEILREQARQTGKPDHVIEKIVEGRLEKFFEENCLLEQNFVKNPDMTIEDYIKTYIAKLGENIRVKRFIRFELGKYES